MRVIAGTLRSRPLTAPPGLQTRPTTDRLRETLFNILTQGATDRVAGHHFLDLYSGSGAVGIEALSRGASHTVFVEQALPALAILKQNLANLNLRAGLTVEKRSVQTYLRREAKSLESAPPARQFTTIFLDPPYDSTEYDLALTLLGNECATLLAPNALVIAEHRKKSPLPNQFGQLQRIRLLHQGDAALSFYQLAPN